VRRTPCGGSGSPCVVYYESRKRELKIRLMNEGRGDERLKARVAESTCLTEVATGRLKKLSFVVASY
jgi:hypothetical protein